MAHGRTRFNASEQENGRGRRESPRVDVMAVIFDVPGPGTIRCEASITKVFERRSIINDIKDEFASRWGRGHRGCTLCILVSLATVHDKL